MADDDLAFGRTRSAPIDRALPELSAPFNRAPGMAHLRQNATQDTVRTIGDYASQQVLFAITSIYEEHDRVVKELNLTIKRLKDELALVQFIDPAFIPSRASSDGDSDDGFAYPSHPSGGTSTVNAKSDNDFEQPNPSAESWSGKGSTHTGSVSPITQPSGTIRSSYASHRSSHVAPAPLESSVPGSVKEPGEILPDTEPEVLVGLASDEDSGLAPDEIPMRCSGVTGRESVASSIHWNMACEPDQHKQNQQMLRATDRHETKSLKYPKRRCWEMDADRFADLSFRCGSERRSLCMPNTPRTLAEQLISLEQQAIGAAADKCVLHPQSRKRLVWDILAMLFLMYDLIVVPLHVFELPANTGLYIMDIIILIYWTMDILVSFLTGVFSNGHLLLTVKHIAPVYLRRWFAFDCFIIFPEWLVALSHNGKVSAESHVGLARVLRSTRFVRILRFLRLLRLMKVDKVLRDLKGRINNNAYLLFLSLIRLTVGVVFLIHCLACAWFGLGRLSPDGWIFIEDIANKSLGERYLFSFQFAMARLHPSSYDKNMTLVTIHERIFAIVTSLMALAGCGAFVSSVTNTMAQLQSFRQQRIRKLFVIREYVRDYNISVHLSTRVQKYIEKSITRKLREQHANELSTMLPLTLLLDLRFEAWIPFLAPQEFLGEFTDLHPRTVWCLGREALHEVSVLSGETLFYIGDSCCRVLFLTTGKLTYVLGQTAGINVEDLKEHQRDVPIAASISEAVLWTPWENKGEMCAFTDSALLMLSAKEFSRTVRENERALFDAVKRCEAVVTWLRTESEYVSDLFPKEWVGSASRSTSQSRRSTQSSSMHVKGTGSENFASLF